MRKEDLLQAPREGGDPPGGTDRLSAGGIRAALGDHPWAERLEVFSVIGSTNDVLKDRAAAGAPHGTAAIADCQTGGRGRLGRRFDSPPGSGIYLSVLLRPDCPAAELMTLTAQAAVAVSRAIERVCGVRPGIKWVNDLLLDGKKICGILTELSLEAESGRVAWAIIGIGINCNRTAESFPPELREIAGSILSRTGRRVDRNRLAAEVLRELSGLPIADWREAYRADCVNLGQAVRLIAPGRPDRCGLALDVGENAELLVCLDDGTAEAVTAGEVSLRGPDEG